VATGTGNKFILRNKMTVLEPQLYNKIQLYISHISP